MASPDPAPSGYTLPVWVAAAARAAVVALRGGAFTPLQPLELLDPPGVASVPVEAASALVGGWCLGQARCDPGEGLDLTRGLLIWVLVRWDEPSGGSGAAPTGQPDDTWLQLEAGEGVGVLGADGAVCLSAYARRLLLENLRPLRLPGHGLRLRLVFPAGRSLAERTSNAAFGVVEGLALIGTRALVEASASPDQLQQALDTLRERVAAPDFSGDLVLVIGANGLDLATGLGLPAHGLVRGGNWLGPLLVAAADAGVRRLLLFGYQGKLLKLAAGIFHTHHHLADGRAEALTALAALEGVGGEPLRQLFESPTVEAALAGLEAADPALAQRLRDRLVAAVERRSVAYLGRHGVGPMAVGAVIFDRARRIRASGPVGGPLLAALTTTAGPATDGP